ncbi:hypothetical protein WICANDRAFT_75976 [Wickerhamomyces anomalus NRRL Y-366-8]|uniref:Zn(2)-C6 fungal-type domain-containing protein n=1 Tax=Wickerhamomyces anomalus (strain ATCC 58044 / CBS 1984 / NCYC 433 / NRRL Y-366-8) TaxID=683960 RepID=A0A1E3P8Z7_WICAA|nr:uncharacterized protein WICANDRAFT_75976 [Wickerhamomyces anomalus NRRL Y-366-8]ODQ61780.1 hypothetical protein WICANDRAFT_75976 [Wickerhamomyces anomalus NRRL Y-366-8]
MPEKTAILDPPVNLSDATNTSSTASNTKKRVRTGCLNCRKKHKKCDETKPICKTCQLKNEHCEWPTPKLKRSSSRRSSHGHPTISIPPVSSATQNYPIYSRPIPSQPVLQPQTTMKRQRIEGTSPLEQQHTLIQPQQQQQAQPPPSSFPPPQLSQYLPSYEPQKPRRISADLSSYSLGNQYQQQPPSSSESFLDQQQQQQQQQQQLPAPPRLNLNNLLNTHHEPSAIPKRISVDSSETQVSNSSLTNGTDVSPISNNTTLLDISTFKILTTSLSHFFKTEQQLQQFPNMNLVSSISPYEQVSLLETFNTGIAPRLNILDSHFIKYEIPQISKESPCVKNAMFATSCFLLKDFTRGFKFYSASVNNIHTSSWLEKCITGMLLTLISTMVLDVEDWRFHIRDYLLFLERTISTNGMDHGIPECYWWAVLTDINGLDIGEDTTVSIIEDNNKNNEVSEIIKLLAMTVNLISMDFIDFDTRWEILWNKVDDWFESRSKNLISILHFADLDDSLFPLLVYGSGSSALSLQLYHTLMILLIQNKPRLFKLSNIKNSKNFHQVTWYAKNIIGINLNNQSLQCWNNSNQCIWIAGKLLTHQDEHKLILNLINDVELKIGHHCFKYKSQDLKNYWDHDKSDL